MEREVLGGDGGMDVACGLRLPRSVMAGFIDRVICLRPGVAGSVLLGTGEGAAVSWWPAAVSFKMDGGEQHMRSWGNLLRVDRSEDEVLCWAI